MAGQMATANCAGYNRFVLRKHPEGVYCFVFERTDSQFPEQDYLYDSWEQAKERCLEEWGVPLNDWAPTDEDPDA